MLDVILTRGGHLALSESLDDGAAAGLSEAAATALRAAFERGIGELSLCLVMWPEPAAMPPVLAFWRRLGERYLTELCHVPEPAENLQQPLAAPLLELSVVSYRVSDGARLAFACRTGIL